MCIHRTFLLVIYGLFFFESLHGINPDYLFSRQNINLSVSDTLKADQILYNGRVWRNLHYMVKEDQFFLSAHFLQGSVTIGGKTFDNISIRYDLYTDQIQIPLAHGPVLQLNKEMVDSFSLSFMNKEWRFVNIKEDSLNLFNGYVNVLYKGKSELYVKYGKKIALLAVDKMYDKFYQVQNVFLIKNNLPYQITNERKFTDLFGEDEKAMKDYIRTNKIVLSKKNPESFIPVISYYDNMR